MKIEISGPDDQGQYTVEIESDQAAMQEEGMPAQGGEEAEAPGAGTQVCKSVDEVCAVIKSALGGEDPKAMWDEEAASRASTQQQQQPY